MAHLSAVVVLFASLLAFARGDCYELDEDSPVGCSKVTGRVKCGVQLACFWLPPVSGKPFANLSGFKTGWLTGAQDIMALPGGRLAVGTDNHVVLFRYEDLRQGGQPYAYLIIEKPQQVQGRCSLDAGASPSYKPLCDGAKNQTACGALSLTCQWDVDPATDSCKQWSGECLVKKLLPLQNGGLGALWGERGGRGVALFNASTLENGVGGPYRVLKGPASSAAEFGPVGSGSVPAFVVEHEYGDAMDPHSEVQVVDGTTGRTVTILETPNVLGKGTASTYCTRLMDGRVAVGQKIYDAQKNFSVTTCLGYCGRYADNGTVWNTAQLTTGDIAMGGWGGSCESEVVCPQLVTIFNASAIKAGGSGKSHTELTIDMWADAMIALPGGGLAAGTRAGTINLFSAEDVQAGNPPYARLQGVGPVHALAVVSPGKGQQPVLAAANSGNPGNGGVQLFHIPLPIHAAVPVV